MARKRQKKTSTHKFRSGFEEEITDVLDKRRVPYKYEERKLPYTLTKNYIPDIELPNGILVELKGEFDLDDRAKMKAVKEQYPDLDIRIVFQQNNFLHKMSKESKKKRLDKATKGGKIRKRETYKDWAEKHGYKCAVGTIPMEWIYE